MNAGGVGVFLDRDGTVNEQMGYINHLDRIRILEGAAEGIKRLNSLGIPVIVVSNQSGAARGYFPVSLVEETNALISNLLEAQGARIDRFYYCPHLPGAKVKEFDRKCECRKPGPGMLLKAAGEFNLVLERCFMVGDRLPDIETAHRVGATGILVKTGYGRGELLYGNMGRTRPIVPDYVAENLAQAAAWIEERLKGAR